MQGAWVASCHRFHTIPAGRRSGKTEIAKRKLIQRALTTNTSWDDPRYFAAAPTRDQAKAIYWADLKAMIPRMLMSRDPLETDLSIKLVNGAEIYIVGMDKPERIEGRPWDGGILDEFANMKPGAWGENVRPALSDRQGWCDLIGVPEGRNHYYDLWKYAISGVDPEWAGFTWFSSDILPPQEVASARRQLDPLIYAQEYEGSFINFEGRAYYPFQESEHAAQPLLYDSHAPLIFCFDFNVDPGIAAVLQEQKLPNGIQGTGVIGEVHIPRNSNTVAVCNKLIEDWGQHAGSVVCYGDSTGGARGSAKVSGSDWDLIRNTLIPAFRDRISFRIRSSNPPERARVNAMNTRLKGGDGTIRMMVDPAKTPNVIRDLEGVRLLAGGSGEIDKKIDVRLSHLSDAIGYYIHVEFPVQSRAIVSKGMFG